METWTHCVGVVHQVPTYYACMNGCMYGCMHGSIYSKCFAEGGDGGSMWEPRGWAGRTDDSNVVQTSTDEKTDSL